MNIEKKKFSIEKLKYPASDKIQSRTSTVARSMASTLMPRIGASKTDIDTLKEFLGELDKCVYCGNDATHLDHLFPLIVDQFPTGYCTDPANLVPCCSECNGSKGSKNWWEYMNIDNYDQSDEKQCKIINRLKNNSDNCNLDQRKENLKLYCKKFGLPYENSVESNHKKLFFDDEIKSWWDAMYNNIKKALDTAQIQIDAFNAGIKTNILGMNKDFNTYIYGLRDIALQKKKQPPYITNELLEESNELHGVARKAYELGYNKASSIVNDNCDLKNYYSDDNDWLKYVKIK